MQLYCYRRSGATSPMVLRMMPEGRGSCPSHITPSVGSF
jgi:hypothetical protein